MHDEAAITYFKLLFRNMLEGPEYYHEKSSDIQCPTRILSLCIRNGSHKHNDYANRSEFLICDKHC